VFHHMTPQMSTVDMSSTSAGQSLKVANEAKATLTLAHDNLYILGFKNGSGHWYMVEGLEGSLEGTIRREELRLPHQTRPRRAQHHSA
jgi:hypothetical protein